MWRLTKDMPVSQELNSLIFPHDTVLLQLRRDREEGAPRSQISCGRMEVAHQQAVPSGVPGRIVRDSFTHGFSGTHRHWEWSSVSQETYGSKACKRGNGSWTPGPHALS